MLGIFWSNNKWYIPKLGYDPYKFSLAYLTDFELLRKFVDFMHDRNGSITVTATKVLGYAKSLMLNMEKDGQIKKFGFLLQNPEYSNRLLNPISNDQWDAWCAKQTLIIKQYLGELNEGKHIKQGRNPEDPIRSYLDRQHPITVFFEIAENMRLYLEKHGQFMSVKQLISIQRDLLMFEMFPTQPLRIKMYSIMTYHKDNSGNLYQKADGSWAIRFLASDFKNEKSAVSDKEYNVPIETELWPKIENFLYNVRPQFNDNRPNIFISVSKSIKSKKTVKPNKTISDGRGDVAYLSDAVGHRTRQFLNGCPGFGPHAIRHLVATDYIKNNPNGYQVAADILHDRLDTVLKHYAHLKASDGHRHYQQWFFAVRDKWRKES